MSAYVVNKRHIDALLTAALKASQRDHSSGFRWFTHSADGTEYASHELTQDNADEIGAMLWHENARSVHYRYPKDGPTDLPGPRGFNSEADPYVYFYERLQEPLTPAEAMLAISGYEYQSCEHPGWNAAGNVAHEFCRQLLSTLCSTLPEYEAAKTWEVDAARPVVTIFRGRSKARGR